MADALRRYASSNPIEDILRLFDLIAFNYIIGNCDAHLKNYSLMRSDDWRELSLAPCVRFGFDDGLSRADYCHGLVCWRKEATRGRRTGRFC